MFALSGRIRDLSGLRVSPAVENTLSEGVGGRLDTEILLSKS